MVSSPSTIRLFTEPNHPGNNVRAIAFDDKGVGYFGTRTGEVYKRFESGKTTEIKTPKSASSNHIRSIHVDENNLVWIGTYSSGLWLVKEDSVFQIDKKLGLFDNQVSTIIEDENHRFWMSCNLGIYMVPKENLLRLSKGEIKNIGCLTFSQTDGMGSSETNGGFYPAGAINNNGKVFIPTINGLSIINTKRVDFASENSEVKIELILADGIKILPKHGTYVLPKETQNIEIHYDSPNLLYPEKISFQYQLKPLQKQVQFVGKRKVAYLQNLKPGPHTFELKASNQLGEFVGESLKISLYREFYFFETKSFIALIILAIFTLIFGSFWGYIKIQKRRQHQLEGLVNERTKELELEKQATEKALNTIEQQAENLKQLNDNKSKFFAIVSHDIKNLITSFDGMGEIARHYVETKKFDRFNRITDMLDVSSSRLTLFLDNVLKWSIGELDRTPYNPEPVKIVDQIELIKALVSPMLDQKELKLNLLVGDCVALADPHALALILRNLVNNAIKFSPEKGSIQFECETQNNEVIIGVKNRGEGLSNARIKELENAKNSHSELGTFGEEGTGLGLHLVHVFLELNKGRLMIESEEGLYTKFKIYLPAKTD
jgi:signal transduction histidine kinase